MKEIIIPEVNWTLALAGAIKVAEEGDVIVVSDETRKELGERAKGRMRPEANITFVVRKAQQT